MSAVKAMYERVSERLGFGGLITSEVLAHVRANVGSVSFRSATMVKCEECGEPIPEERLEALPDTTRCVECARKKPATIEFDPDVVCAAGSE